MSCNTSLFVKQIVVTLVTRLWRRLLWGGLLCVWDVHTCLWYWINRWSIMHLGVGVSLLIHFASRLCYRQLWAKSQLTSAALVTYLAFYHEGEGHSAQPRARVQLILLLGVLLKYEWSKENARGYLNEIIYNSLPKERPDVPLLESRGLTAPAVDGVSSSHACTCSS